MNYTPIPKDGALGYAPIARRVVLVVASGLRPDAIHRFDLFNLQRLADRGASTLRARSVSPSTTVASIGSLMTGVSPAVHGMRADRVTFPRSISGMETLPKCIGNEGFRASAFISGIPQSHTGTARLVGRSAGFQTLSTKGHNSAAILSASLDTLCTQRRGLVAIHFPDAETEGRNSGFMSDAYGMVARRIDQSIGILDALRGTAHGDTLLIVVADQAGDASDIPIIISGRHTARCSLADVALLDIPPTILWALGINTPRNYEGRVLTEAFETVLLRSKAPA